MLYRGKYNSFEICPFKATFTVEKNGKSAEKVKYIYDKEWFESILNEHEVYSNLTYEEVVLTDVQLDRFNQIKYLEESSIKHCINYVKDGSFPEGNNHELRNIQLELENQRLGQALSNLEIEILELKLRGL